MATTFRWYINELDSIPDYNGYPYFVTKISYRYNAVNDSGYSADITGQIFFNEVNDTPEHPYVQYSGLTQTEVIEWLNTYSDVSTLQSQLEAIISDKMNPPVVSLPLPWEQ